MKALLYIYVSFRKIKESAYPKPSYPGTSIALGTSNMLQLPE